MRNVLAGQLGHMPWWRASLGLFSARERRLATAGLDEVGMLHKAAQRTDSLSGGEKQRVAIARALAQAPQVLLADEPVANLDPELADDVLGTLRTAAKDVGVTTLVNIHNVVQARRYAERIIGIARGVVVFDGKPDELDQSALQRIYRYDRADAPADEFPDLAASLDPAVLLDLDHALEAGELHSAARGGQA